MLENTGANVWRQAMCRRFSSALNLVSLASLVTLVSSSVTPAQTAQDLVGAWQVVSVVNTAKDGTTSDVFGPNMKGITIFAPDGHFAWILTRASLPKFASDNRLQGTPEENKAIVQGSQAFFGTYSVADKVITLQIQGSTWPAWTGTTQPRPIGTFSKDKMVLQSAVAAIGGSNVITLTR